MGDGFVNVRYYKLQPGNQAFESGGLLESGVHKPFGPTRLIFWMLLGSLSLLAQPTILEYTVPTAASTPARIVTGPDGNLWFTESDANKVARISTSGAITEFAIPTPNSQPWASHRSGKQPDYLLCNRRRADAPSQRYWRGDRGQYIGERSAHTAAEGIGECNNRRQTGTNRIRRRNAGLRRWCHTAQRPNPGWLVFRQSTAVCFHWWRPEPERSYRFGSIELPASFCKRWLTATAITGAAPYL